MTIQPAVVAGTFYPADAGRLGQTVDDFINAAPKIGAPPPKALILPHAGYRFSGAAAAAAAASLVPGPTRVVILGPSHRHAFKGVALPAADAMQTPLGTIALDTQISAKLLQQSDVQIVPEAFAAEHAIEVELPFLQHSLGDFKLVPLVVGDIAPTRLAQILDSVWGDDETLIVISTDLTHFLDAKQAEATDAQTAIAIERAEPKTIDAHKACGHRPLAAFLHCANARGLRLTRAALTHSGRVTEDQTRVVGYGAWLAHAPEKARLSDQHRVRALRLARQALQSRAARGKAPAIHLPSFPAVMQGQSATFVTLTLEDRLRGCIGSLKAHRPMASDIMENAIKAGFEDPRFAPVTADELKNCQIEIALLSRPAPMTFLDQDDLLNQLVPGRDGLILQSNSHRGTFLPKVWDSLPTPEAFFSGLRVKAGLSRDHWSPDMKIWRYMAEAFEESAVA